jgi:hypothetical protein
MNTLLEVLSDDLKPLCPRDNHVMKYESRHSQSNSGDEASYHCGLGGCSVRYNPADGYFMLIGMPDHPNPIEEPGVNVRRCPVHQQWLYRRVANDRHVADWLCSVEGCEYAFSS